MKPFLPVAVALAFAFGNAAMAAQPVDDTPAPGAPQSANERAGLRQLPQGHFLDSILGQGKELGVYTVPGDGAIDYVSVFDALKDYSGWVVLEAEQDPTKAPALPYAKKGVAHIRAALEEAGLA